MTVLIVLTFILLNLSLEPNLRIGHGFDIHRLIEGTKLVIGGVEIPFHLGADAHSDGDALYHRCLKSTVIYLGYGLLILIILFIQRRRFYLRCTSSPRHWTTLSRFSFSLFTSIPNFLYP